MKSVQAIFDKKEKVIFSVSSETSVYEALQIMMEKDVSALLITKEGQLKGIFTERDYARKIVLQGRTSKETAIKDVMTQNPFHVATSDPIEKCMKIMTEKHIRHLPVVDNGVLTGVISIGDLLKYIIEDQKSTIEHLQNYINS